jgi:hypothetical protein
MLANSLENEDAKQTKEFKVTSTKLHDGSPPSFE